MPRLDRARIALRLPWAVMLAAILAATSSVRALTPDSGTGAALMRDLRAQNAHHLAATGQAPAASPTGAVLEGGAGPQPLRIAVGDLVAQVTAENDGKFGPVAVLSLFRSGRQLIRIRGAESGFEQPPFLVQIAEMDGIAADPEVLFSTYTGGAHCCSQTHIARAAGDRWQAVAVGSFDGDLVRAQDIDGDGRFELALADDRFYYAFACYACSAVPLRVLRLQDGRVIDASDDPRYRPAHVAWLKSMIEAADPAMDRNGFLAGYVAEKIRLGEGEQAWRLMLRHYDRRSDWGLERCVGGRVVNGTCRGRLVRLTFPEALRRFLRETGYQIP